MARLRSPSYPSFSLEDAISHADAIFKQDRTAPIDREVAARHLGYKSLNGAADKALSTMMQYGLLEKVAKGEVCVAQRSIDILVPDNPAQRKVALSAAAGSPKLFDQLFRRFPDAPPSDDALRTYLLRENFNDRAIGPVITAFKKTCAFLEREGASESAIPSPSDAADSTASELSEVETTELKFGGANVGDLIQWEVNGSLQMETPMRVRLVTEDGQWVAVEGSETGIPMEQVTVMERGVAPKVDAPRFAIEQDSLRQELPQDEVAEGWKEERLLDDGGEEIFIRYRGDPTPERYTYIRDYLDFKLLRMKKD